MILSNYSVCVLQRNIGQKQVVDSVILSPPFTFAPFSFVCVNSHGFFVCVSPQEFLSDREHGQARLSTVGASGELLILVVSKDRVEGIKAKVANAREDWKSLMNNLQMREDALKVHSLFGFGCCFLDDGFPPKRKCYSQREYMVKENSAMWFDVLRPV